MTLKFCSIASGSSGNCYLVKTENSAILIDAGISGKRIFAALEETGTPLDMVRAVIVTHEHIDHVRSLPILSRKIPGVKIYANEGTWRAIERPVDGDKRETFITGETFSIDDLIIKPFAVSHDAADPVGFSIYGENRKISFCTDSGYITDEMFEEIHDANLLLIEANHEKELLLVSGYPYSLKQRILGDMGHLSNVTTGEWIARIVNHRPMSRRVLLGHLSKENNTPEMAFLTIRNTLEENGIYVGEKLKIEVALRDVRSHVFEV